MGAALAAGPVSFLRGKEPPPHHAPYPTMTKRRIAGLVFGAAGAVTSCTTFLQPTTCVPGSASCAGIRDARFCELEAAAVEGADCANLGIASSKPFCVVTTIACTETSYVVADHDCRVLRYVTVRDAAFAGCPQGAPTFVSR